LPGLDPVRVRPRGGHAAARASRLAAGAVGAPWANARLHLAGQAEQVPSAPTVR